MKRRLEATRDVVQKKDSEITMDGTCEQRGRFKENGKEKDICT